ncbi:mCG116127, isoform CRA_b [Mus musculus]|nr:mCG116127, isoform CRA_b [Mus musculus]
MMNFRREPHIGVANSSALTVFFCFFFFFFSNEKAKSFLKCL